MSLQTPDTQALATTIVGQLEASLSTTIPFLPKLFTRVLAKVLAGAVVIVYRYAGFSFLQMFIRTASNEETWVNGRSIRPLTEWGRQLGVSDPTPGVAAELVIELTVQSQTGTLPAGSQLLAPDIGVVYQTKTAVTLDAATKQVTILAIGDPAGGGGYGTVGNVAAGGTVQFVNPIAQIATDATVISQAVVGVDAEATEDYRARVLSRSQAKPQGGAHADYRAWGLEVAAVVGIYPYASPTGVGEIDVYVEVSALVDPDGIPNSSTLDDVLDAINLDEDGKATRRPVGAAVNTLPIGRTAFDLEITNLIAADAAATQAAIAAAVDEYLRAREPYIVGLSVLPRKDRITVGHLAGIVHEVAGSRGATVGDVALLQSGSTITAQSLGAGEKAKLGTISYP